VLLANTELSDNAVLQVTFYGVRGSTPTPCADNQRYGGNTSCVTLEVDGESPIVFDLGTGLRFWGERLGRKGAPFAGTALVTHLHWDHVQGLPFFMPINREGARLEVIGPSHDGCSLEDSFSVFMRPPFFPVTVEQLLGHVTFRSIDDGEVQIGTARVVVRQVPHVGGTNGYRVEWAGASVAYVSDHQEPPGRPGHVDDAVLELCDGVDLLIHDAQYTPDEFAEREHWGHCTVRYAVEVARQARAKQLALFHHDPAHHDERVDELLSEAQGWADELGVPCVFAAQEGQRLTLGHGASRPAPRR
jgi:phosphoribosyl 1,2-cyclic phosphodiesterase